MPRCECCNVEDAGPGHNSTETHGFNYLLHEWNRYRKKIAKDKDGIKVSQRITTTELQQRSCVENATQGKYTLTITSSELQSVNNKIEFALRVFNDRREDLMFIMKATLLAPYGSFHISDERNTWRNGEVIELSPRHHYDYTVRFQLYQPLIGSYKMPVAFTFQVSASNDTNAMKSFSIARQIVVVVSDFEEEPEDKTKSPFRFENWDDIIAIIPPNAPLPKNQYPVPGQYRRILMTGLNEKYVKPEQMPLLNHLRDIFGPDEKGNGTRGPTEATYHDFFHFLLWIDALGAELMIQRYNMSKVTMTAVANGFLELEVPGLAEKRPSLVHGDHVRIRFQSDHTVYKGIVSRINDKTIHINKMHSDLYEYVRKHPEVELDVAFELNHLTYNRMHKAIDVCINKGLLRTLLPGEQPARRPSPQFNIPRERFFNNRIFDNNEQRTAVINILNATSSYAPYIVFGPPGTGKTETIVEAIMQIMQNLPKSRILVCAPANAACDMLAEKLLLFVKDKKQLIRIHAETRNWNEVPDRIKPYSNHDGGRYTQVNLSSYRIVVTTLILIGKYSGNYSPDHVFIDEAAQAMEPEANVAVSMLQPGKQLVLAGDPKQLGPQCSSAAAEKLKLGVSLLERLMNTNDLYLHGNAAFITMLKLNYRAHPTVLEVPNRLFYDNQLRAVNQAAADDPISNISIHTRIPKYKQGPVKGSPVEFCSVMAKERREGKSPSYFNESEIQTVVDYVKAMLTLPEVSVQQREIGIITPYIRQMHKIRFRLQDLDYRDIEVGTTEVFQGREKRIIIISTVRSQHDLLLVDEKYKLGFVKNEKRMNVALTRAKSKLIVIGNPHVLGTSYNPKNTGEQDRNWEFYIKFCEDRGAFFGTQYLRRTKEVKDDIVSRFANIRLQENVTDNSRNNTNNTGSQRGRRRR